ncbi:MAG: helix-turn-helix domain-containing protein [Sandaracinaceae bacterium]
MGKEDPPFGPQLRAARERAGLNKNQLARELSTSWQHVDNWERDRVQPSLGSVRRLAELLSVSSDFLLGLVADPALLVLSPLDEYLQDGAPDDLTPTEEQWLRDAPIDPNRLAPGAYAQLLASLRGASASPSSRRKPQSGVRSKVERAAVEKPKRRSRAGRNRSGLAHQVDKSAIAAAIADDDPE